MAFGAKPTQIGSLTGINASTSAPTQNDATAGFDTQSQRFVNVWYRLTGGTSADTTVYLYRTGIGWILYTDVPQLTLTTANFGGVVQVETRGAERIYVRLQNFVGPPTVDVILESVTY